MAGAIPKAAREALNQITGLQPEFVDGFLGSVARSKDHRHLLGDHLALQAYAVKVNKAIQDDLASRNTLGIGRGVERQSEPHPTPPHTGLGGALYQGLVDSFWGREGYTVNPVGSTNLKEAMDEARYRQEYSRRFWHKMPDNYKEVYSPLEEVAYRAGAVGGTIVGNGVRHLLWNAHPGEVFARNAARYIAEAPDGFPSAKTEWVAVPNETLSGYGVYPRRDFGVKESGLLASGGAFAGYEMLGYLSGNYDPLNVGEGMRPEGFSAVTPDDNDPRKSTAPVLDILQRHFLGRKGRILPWEEFHQERPDISYADYTRYRDWQAGKTNDDPIGKATFGIAKLNVKGLSGLPEAQIMGVNIAPLGLAAGALTVLGARKLNTRLGQHYKKQFDNFMDGVGNNPDVKIHKGAKGYQDITMNPFYRKRFRTEDRSANFSVDMEQPIPI